MSSYVKVGRVSDFREGRGKAVDVAGERVAIFRADGTLRALQNACPHMGAELADGQIEGSRVVCERHGWEFDLETGASGRRSGAYARVYEVKVVEEEVFVRRPDERAAAPDPDEDWVAWDPDKHLKGNRDLD